jgi:hypothetical protein
MLPNWHLSHDIIRHAPDEMRAGSVDMASIEKIWSYEVRGEQTSWSFGDKRYVFFKVVYSRVNNIKLLKEMTMS